MGLFDFIKDAGARVFGKEDKEPPKETRAREFTREEVEAFHNKRKAKKLGETVAALGFEAEGLQITVDGDTATVRGAVDSQADREKIVLVVGNTAGIARVDDQMEVSTPEPEAQYYTVVSGDSLSKIAKAHYGNAMKYPVIFEANKPMLADPNKIYPGQVLRIPPLDADA